MRRAITAMLTTVLLPLAACGSAEDDGPGGAGGGGQQDADGASSSCAAPGAALSTGRVVTTADLDGDGTGDRVRVLPGSGECPALLGATTSSGAVSTELPADQPPISSAFAVGLAGRDGALLVTRQDHPRGGFQVRVYAGVGDRLTELTRDGAALVPFVATDVQEHPLSVGCEGPAIVLTEAVAHEPVGVVAAWDVRRTSYTLDGGELAAGPSREVADNVLPAQLGKRFPQLVRHSVFPGCRAS